MAIPPRGPQRPHADRVLRAQGGDVVIFWTAEDPQRPGLKDLGTEARALEFLRTTREPAVTAGTLRRFLRGTWLRTAGGPSNEARQKLFGLVFGPGLLSGREADELLVLVAQYLAAGKLRVERMTVPSGGRARPASAEPERAPPTMTTAPRTRLTWIGIELVDGAGDPVAGEEYEITLPDGSVRKGTLDGDGKARERGVDEGTCQVTFPKRDAGSWEWTKSTPE